MTRYIVDIPATTVETYTVEAESPEEAIAAIADGDGEMTVTCYVPDWNQDRSTWKVRQQKEIMLSKGTLTLWMDEEEVTNG